MNNKMTKRTILRGRLVLAAIKIVQLPSYRELSPSSKIPMSEINLTIAIFE